MRFGKGRLFGRRTSAPGTPVAARRHARAAAKANAHNSRGLACQFLGRLLSASSLMPMDENSDDFYAWPALQACALVGVRLLFEEIHSLKLAGRR
ncbi:hypothetical protein MRX96_024289 [Rhipicephalus microplus]